MKIRIPAHRQNISKIVADKDWQALRVSFMGTWKTHAPANVRALRAYLGDMKDPLKVRRVLNYLVGSGFRIGVISHPQIDRLLATLRNKWAQIKARET